MPMRLPRPIPSALLLYAGLRANPSLPQWMSTARTWLISLAIVRLLTPCASLNSTNACRCLPPICSADWMP